MIARDQGEAELARFRAEAQSAVDLRALADCFTREIARFGPSVFAAGHVAGDNRPNALYLTTWPRAWTELYAASGFIADDPIVREARESRQPCTLAELIRRQGITRNRVLDAARDFGFASGFFVPVHGPGDARGLVAIAARQFRIAPGERHVLTEKARTVHAVARRLWEARPPGARPALAPREREALALVARGLDDAEIAVRLGVTRNSAHVYVERAKRRLGAATRAQAVAVAMADGLL